MIILVLKEAVLGEFEEEKGTVESLRARLVEDVRVVEVVKSVKRETKKKRTTMRRELSARSGQIKRRKRFARNFCAR